MVALLALISRATALIDAPSANRCNVSSRCLSDSAAGRPNFFPSALARACPDSVRSISKSRSNCQCRLKSPHLCRLKIPHSVTWPVCVDWWPSSSREMSVSSKALWKVNVL